VKNLFAIEGKIADLETIDYRAKASQSRSFIFSLSLVEHLNFTTFLALSIKSLPVAGFLPRRLLFAAIQNFPNPLMSTSSPEANAFLTISKMLSTSGSDLRIENPHRSLTARMRSLFVRFFTISSLFQEITSCDHEAVKLTLCFYRCVLG